MKRREFMMLLGGAVATSALWQPAAWAQQGARMRRVGALMNLAADDVESPPRVSVFAQGLQALGWQVGRNVRVDYRWGSGDVDLYRKYAAELVALAPDVVLASTTPTVRALQQVSRAVPIVFAGAIDPVGSGLVASLARPGGNITGFTLFEYGLSAKWLELLKQVAPKVKRVAVLRDPANAAGVGQLGAIQSVAPAFGVELTLIDVADAAEIQSAIATFARVPNSGMVVTSSTLAQVHRDLIITLAAQHRLPAVFPFRPFVADGGLVSYGPDLNDPYRRAASYVDRILKGERPADLPVQAPTKYELVINLKAAKALSLAIPPTMLAIADEVIE